MPAPPHRSVMSLLQAERWGAELVTEDVEEVDLQQRPFLVRTSDTEVGLQTLQFATPESPCKDVPFCLLALSASRKSTEEFVTSLNSAEGCLR